MRVCEHFLLADTTLSASGPKTEIASSASTASSGAAGATTDASELMEHIHELYGIARRFGHLELASAWSDSLYARNLGAFVEEGLLRSIGEAG